MKQEINLFKVEKKKEIILSFKKMLKVMSAFFGIMVLISIYDAYDYYGNQKILNELQKKQREFNKQLLAVGEKLPPQQTRDQIIAENKKLESDLEARKEILSTLTMLQSTRTMGFSNYLIALAAESFAGLWLTRFKLRGDGSYILLEGDTQRPEYVPRFLEGLSKESIFKGKSFQVFNLKADKAKELTHFVVETKMLPKIKGQVSEGDLEDDQEDTQGK